MGRCRIAAQPPGGIGNFQVESINATRPLYGPTDFLRTGPLGSWRDLERFSQKALEQGRGVGCDLVLQHTASQGVRGSERRAAPPFSQSEIGALGPFGWNIDYAQASARQKAHRLVQDYVSRGVRFLRYDAAHMIPPAELAQILLPAGQRPEVMQVLELAGARSDMMDYLARLGRSDIRAYDLSWTAAANKALHGRLGELDQACPLPYGQTLLPISTHDFFVMGEVGAPAPIDFPLLRFFGLTAFSLPTQVLTTDHALPTSLARIGVHSSSSMRELEDLLAIRARIQNQPLFWLRTGNPDCAIAYQRGDCHLFAMSRLAGKQNIVVEHALRPGTYRELFSGRRYSIDKNPIVLTQQTENRYALVKEDEQSLADPPRMFSVPPVVHMIWCQGVHLAPTHGAGDSFRKQALTVQEWDCERFEKELLPTLNSRQSAAYKHLKEIEVAEPRHRWMMLSDFMRLVILAHCGGYYADWDSRCHWPFQQHFQDYELVVALQDDGRINNAFIAASTQSQPIQSLLARATDRILSLSGTAPPNVCWPAGPDLFTEQVKNQLGTLVLPPQVYISYQPGRINPSCYVSHFYASVCGDQMPTESSRKALYRPGTSPCREPCYPDYRSGLYGNKICYGEEAGIYNCSYYAEASGLQEGERGWRPHAGKPPVPAPEQSWVWIDALPESAANGTEKL